MPDADAPSGRPLEPDDGPVTPPSPEWNPDAPHEPPSEPTGRRPARRPSFRIVGIVAGVALIGFLLFRLFGWSSGGRFSPGVDSLLYPVRTLANNLLKGLFPDSTRAPLATAPSPAPSVDSLAALARTGAGLGSTVPPTASQPTPGPSPRPALAPNRAARPVPPVGRNTPETASQRVRRRRGNVSGQPDSVVAATVDTMQLAASRRVRQVHDRLEVAMVAVQSDIAIQRGLNPGLAGEVTVQLTIAPDGSVSRTDVVRNTTGNEQLPRRIVLRLQKLRFPPNPTGLPVTLTLPFTILR